MIRRLRRGGLPWPLLGAIAATTSFVLFGGDSNPHEPAQNIWDRLLPALVDTRVTNVVLVGWWMLALLPVLARLRSPEVLVRYGSLAAATRGALRTALVPLIVGLISVTVVAAVAVIAATPARWSWTWSTANPAAGTPGASSAEALSHIFPSPLAAVLMTVGYLGAALVVLELVAATVTLLVSRSAGVALIVLLYLWASLSSFGVFNEAGPLDASRIFNLPWAIRTGAVTSSLSIMAVLVLVSVGLLVLTSGRQRPRVRDLLTGRTVSVACVIVAAAGLAALSPIAGDTDLSAAVARFFQGSAGDIVTYLAVMLLVLGYATAVAARITSRASESYVHEAVRVGTPARWTGRVLGAEVLPLVLVSAGIPLAVASVYAAANPALLSTGSSAVATVLICFVLLAVQIAMYLAVSIATVWCTASAAVWPLIVGIAIVFGYPLVVPLGDANIFASFTMSAPSVEGVNWLAVGASGLVAVTAITIAVVAGRIRRSPATAQ